MSKLVFGVGATLLVIGLETISLALQAESGEKCTIQHILRTLMEGNGDNWIGEMLYQDCNQILDCVENLENAIDN